VPDIDGGGPFNWIRSGTLIDGDNQSNNDWNMIGKLDQAQTGLTTRNAFYENMIGGTWAPYHLVAI
jgi:hypothetical protein